jgi:hypothetical protein
MSYKVPVIIPIRFLASVFHIIVAAIILMSRVSYFISIKKKFFYFKNLNLKEANIYGCGQSLAQSSVYFQMKDTE